MGDAYPELKTGRDAIVRTVRAEEDRFDAVLTSGLPKLEDLLDRTVGVRIDRRLRARTCSASTTRSACRSTSRRTSRSSAACVSTARRSRRRWKRSASARARAARSKRRRPRRSSMNRLPNSQRLERLPDQFVGYTSTDVADAQRRGAVRRRRGARSSDLPAGGGRATSCSTARRSTSRPAVRCPTAAQLRAGGPGRGRRRRAWSGSRLAAPARIA